MTDHMDSKLLLNKHKITNGLWVFDSSINIFDNNKNYSTGISIGIKDNLKKLKVNGVITPGYFWTFGLQFDHTKKQLDTMYTDPWNRSFPTDSFLMDDDNLNEIYYTTAYSKLVLCIRINRVCIRINSVRCYRDLIEKFKRLL